MFRAISRIGNKNSKISSVVLETKVSSSYFKDINLSMMFSNWDKFVGGHCLVNTFLGFSEILPALSHHFLPQSLDLHFK